MSYYTALIAAWNGATQPPTGVIGSGLLGGDTTAQKIAKVNAWAIKVPQPAIVNPTALLNAIVSADFSGLGVNGLTQLQIILTTPEVDISSGNQVRATLATLFAGKTTTLANIVALASPFDNATIPWWSTPVANGGGGLTGQISLVDTTAAGLS